MTITLLVSGGLGYKILQDLYLGEDKLVAVFTDKKSQAIIDFCAINGLPCFAGNPRENRAADFIKKIDCDILFSVNYLFIIESDLINLPKKYAVNIHGSLLPKYRGRTPHVWSVINGEKNAGITAHLIDEEMDNGSILKQVVVPISSDDTGATILEKYNQIYPDLVKLILEDIKSNRVQLTKQDISKATYFGKRTPADGHIDWSWSKERIRNWIRAQAKPYPGAFFFYDDKKIIVHKANFADNGFRQEEENGKIMATEEESLVVKTANGCLRLSVLESTASLNFTKGKIIT